MKVDRGGQVGCGAMSIGGASTFGVCGAAVFAPGQVYEVDFGRDPLRVAVGIDHGPPQRQREDRVGPATDGVHGRGGRVPTSHSSVEHVLNRLEERCLRTLRKRPLLKRTTHLNRVDGESARPGHIRPSLGIFPDLKGLSFSDQRSTPRRKRHTLRVLLLGELASLPVSVWERSDASPKSAVEAVSSCVYSASKSRTRSMYTSTKGVDGLFGTSRQAGWRHLQELRADPRHQSPVRFVRAVRSAYSFQVQRSMAPPKSGNACSGKDRTKHCVCLSTARLPVGEHADVVSPKRVGDHWRADVVKDDLLRWRYGGCIRLLSHRASSAVTTSAFPLSIASGVTASSWCSRRVLRSGGFTRTATVTLSSAAMGGFRFQAAAAPGSRSRQSAPLAYGGASQGRNASKGTNGRQWRAESRRKVRLQGPGPMFWLVLGSGPRGRAAARISSTCREALGPRSLALVAPISGTAEGTKLRGRKGPETRRREVGVHVNPRQKPLASRPRTSRPVYGSQKETKHPMKTMRSAF
eukprot:scaffold7328_cov314-Pinguiococcus_pyrenoidosus.AAC.16